MEDLIELIKILAPASLMLYLAYLLVRSFLNKQLAAENLKISQKNQEVITPIRLQAYERICLLLERISPSNLITRLNDAKYSALELQNILISEVREEFNHNLSQQLYMSEEAWGYVSAAVENVLTLINEAAEGMDEKESSLALAKKIFEIHLGKEKDSLKEALVFVKAEIQTIF